MSGARRVALVTGGSRGIGLGISRCLVRDGFDLAIAGRRDETAVVPVLEELRALGARVVYVQADLGEAADRARLVGAVRERCGRLHVLVNNAGVAPTVRSDILDATEESLDRLLKTNLKGPYFLTQAVARWLVEERRADPQHASCVINVTSVSAAVASPDRGDYCLSKAALAMATKLWAARLAAFGIPVYEVRPGIVRTDMTAGVAEKYDRLIDSDLLLQRRWGLPEDVGRAVAALARGDFAYSTGAVVLVDGGLSVPRL
jgi:NAD(P)-dependent dehydrogenase (short-subunit alcohol dehydrogenase family)